MRTGYTVSTRIPIDVVKRLEALAEKAREANPGANVNRSDIVRMAVLRGLAELEGEKVAA